MEANRVSICWKALNRDDIANYNVEMFTPSTGVFNILRVETVRDFSNNCTTLSKLPNNQFCIFRIVAGTLDAEGPCISATTSFVTPSFGQFPWVSSTDIYVSEVQPDRIFMTWDAMFVQESDVYVVEAFMNGLWQPLVATKELSATVPTWAGIPFAYRVTVGSSHSTVLMYKTRMYIQIQ